MPPRRRSAGLRPRQHDGETDPIPEEIIRRRYERSRLNLVQLLPSLTALRVYDNSDHADPEAGGLPAP